jgi:hypothetical protein
VTIPEHHPPKSPKKLRENRPKNMLGPINRRKLEDLLVTYAHLSAAGVTEQEIREYAELIVDVIKARGVI